MKIQMGKLITKKGTWRIIQDTNDNTNPYKVYLEYYDNDLQVHKRKMEEYGDMNSCLHYIAQYMTGYIWRAVEKI